MKLHAAQRKGYKAVLLMQRRLSGLRYAIRMLISGLIVWLILAVVWKTDPLWGLISSVVVTEVKVQSAWNAFVSRLLNTVIGSLVALVFLKLAGASEWSVLAAMAVATIVSADLIKVPISWRIAPITAAIVMLPAYASHSAHAGLTAALQRTGEVMIGSAVAVAVSWATAGLLGWLPRGSKAANTVGNSGHEPPGRAPVSH
jgi:uncharacterized membrane protein YccC